VLRRRPAASDVDELIISGTFAIDSMETSSERKLGGLAAGARRVLLGGLGLGYTAAAVLSNPVDRLDIVELEGCLVEWAQCGLTEVLQQVTADPRVRLYVADIADVFRGSPLCSGPAGPSGPWDAILLDVDNGPDFLIHPQNAPLYAPPILSSALRQLTPGGLLAIWCQGATPTLEATLRALGQAVQAYRIEVQREKRSFGYVIYTLRPAGSAPICLGQNEAHGGVPHRT